MEVVLAMAHHAPFLLDSSIVLSVGLKEYIVGC